MVPKQAKDNHEAYQIKMAQHQKSLAKLEITEQEDQLQAKFYKFTATFALGCIVTELVKNGGPIEGNKLNYQE